MGIFDKLARKRHENTAGTKSVAADINTTKKAEPPSPPLDSEARIAYQQGFDCYRKGEYEESACFYRISADLGFFRAQYALALSYREGWGVKKDLAEAEMWAQKSAEQGYEAAAELLEEIREKRASSSKAYALGLNFYEQEDYEQAAQHYRTAANLDHAGAQIHLSICYATGRGVERNLDTAEMWARRALTLGDDMAAELLEQIHKDQRDEAFALGIACHDDGDYEQAAQHFRTAANLDHADAQIGLALCYATGKGVKLDLDTARMWANRAVEQGSEEAAEVLAHIRTIQQEHTYDFGLFCHEQGDYEQAVRYFRVAANRGDANAQRKLALCYMNGEGVEKDLAEAATWAKMAAEQGSTSAAELLEDIQDQQQIDILETAVAYYERGEYAQAYQHFLPLAQQGMANAQLILAFLYDEGKGVPQDQQEAAYWYRQAAQQGHADAQYNLALCYKDGTGVEQDQSEAVRWYRMAAEQGYASAQYNLAVCYSQGEGVEENQPEAVRWYHKAAEQGYASAQYNLAICYSQGKGVEENQYEAVRWFRMAAEQGKENAQFNLAVRYEAGNGVEQNQQEAFRWYRAAAQQGLASAQFSLALCYGQGQGTEKDPTEAAHWYRKAAEQGYVSAQFNLALCYENGNGVEQNQSEAIRWYLEAAEQGLTKAQVNLAICYFSGDGVKKDLPEAVRWFRIAAEQGNADAQFNLAICYKYGEGVEKNLTEAFNWYRKAAEQGKANAQYSLAKCYEDGVGVAKSPKQAFHWFTQAAEQGHAKAQFKVGEYYACSEVVKQDLKQALYWYEQSAQQENAEALHELALLYFHGTVVAKDLDMAETLGRRANNLGYEDAGILLRLIREKRENKNR